MQEAMCDIPMLETLSQVESTLRAHFEIKDWQGLRIVLGVAAAHYIQGEPLWVRIIGASRSGRTELLRAIVEDKDSVELESLTPASIRGGLKVGAKILPRINGKRVITKDLAPLITTRKDIRLEIFGLLRSVKDGTLSSDFGSEEGHLLQKATFDWILAVTPIIESSRQLESLLGERFIDLRWIPGDREEMAYRAAVNNPLLDEIRKQLATDVCSLLVRAKETAQVQTHQLSNEQIRMLASYADSVALCRSPIQADRQGHILSMPEPEIGTSLAQDFCRTALGLRLLGVEDWEPYLRRLAWDCIPSIRAKILRELQVQPQSVRELADSTRIPENTTYYHLGQLDLLGITTKKGEKVNLVTKLPLF